MNLRTSKLSKYLDKVCNLRSYYFFSLNSIDFDKPTSQQKLSDEYSFHECEGKEGALLNKYILPEYRALWKNVIEFHKDYNIYYVLNHNQQMVYYFFYCHAKPVYLKEIDLRIELNETETYLSAERTFPPFQNKGISQMAKKYLFNLLFQKKIYNIYVITDTRKRIPEHVYLKLGAKKEKRIFIISFLKLKIILNPLSPKDLDIIRNSNIRRIS